MEAVRAAAGRVGLEAAAVPARHLQCHGSTLTKYDLIRKEDLGKG